MALDVLDTAEAWAKEGRRTALATVTQTWGSAPRPVGSHMLVDDTGDFVGSVSGGCVESSVILAAMDVVASGVPQVLNFGVADELAWKAGLSCGGHIEIFIEPVTRDETAGMPVSLLVQLNAARRDRRLCMVVTDRLACRSALVFPDDASISGDLAAMVAARFASLASGAASIGEERYFFRVHQPPLRLVLIGAVHIAQTLVTLAGALGYDLVIVDPRELFASEARFGGVRLITEWPRVALAALGVDRSTACVTLTHDPKLDDDALHYVLARDCFYVGALGSRTSHAGRLERLRRAGVSDDQLQRINAPVGLKIGALTPEEIAVSILAQVIAAWRADRLDKGTPL